MRYGTGALGTWALLVAIAPALAQEPTAASGSSTFGVDKERAATLGVALAFDQPPKPIKLQRPKYPKNAFAKGIEGTVLVEFVVDNRGRVSQTLVLESVPELDAAALACVKKWTFQPARKAGLPVATLLHAPVLFRIVREPPKAKN